MISAALLAVGLVVAVGVGDRRPRLTPMDPYVATSIVIIMLALACLAAGVIWFVLRPRAPARIASGPPSRFADALRPVAPVDLTPREKALRIVQLQRELGDEAEAREWERTAGDARIHSHRAAQQAAFTYTPPGFGAPTAPPKA